VRLVAGGMEHREIENEQALLVPRAAMLRSCPYVLFSYYSHICAFCPFIALHSPLIFLQQRLLESLIWPRHEVRCFISSLSFDLLGTQTLQKPLFSLLHVPLFLLYGMILFSFSIHFVLDLILVSLLIVVALLLLFVGGLISPSFLAILLFNTV
jgi:hypothetical protein